MKKTHHVQHKSKEDIYRERSTFHQSFSTFHNLEENGDITVQQICLKDNLTDLFPKSLPTATFKKLVHNIGLRQLRDLK